MISSSEDPWLNYICKDLIFFLKKATFCDSGWTWIWGDASQDVEKQNVRHLLRTLPLRFPDPRVHWHLSRFKSQRLQKIVSMLDKVGDQELETLNGRGWEMWGGEQIKAWTVGLAKPFRSLMRSHCSGLNPLWFLLTLGKILQQWVSLQFHRHVSLSHLKGKAGLQLVVFQFLGKLNTSSCLMIGKHVTTWSER